jgi:hypothetical protein
MALGRITGPLLKANLLRQGVDLAFETNLLYLDVKNGRVGIKTATPTNDLSVNGTTRTTNLQVTTSANIATFTVQSNTISSSSNTINLTPNGVNPVVYQGTIVTGNLSLYDHNIATTGTNTDLTISTTGTGRVNINSNVLINGDLHATGTITADGNIQLGDANTDSVTFNADITSNITPDVTNFYDLGAVDKTWRTVYSNNINTTNITASSIIANGIDLTLPPGKTYFVTMNGQDTNAGVHENNPLASIKRALSLATVGDTVYVYPGVYYEIFPLTIPAGVSLRGASLRSVLIQPTVGTIDKDAILVNGETTVEDISLTGFRYNSSNDTGYAFRFANNMTTTTRSPYIRNITVITRGIPSVSSVAAFSVENKAAINRIKAIIPNLVTNTAITRSTGNTVTQDVSLPASDGTTGTALQALIDCVIYVLDNGPATASLPSIVANAGLTTTPALLRAAAIIAANTTFLKAEMSAYINITYPGFWSSYSQTKAERDLGYILTGIQYDIKHGGNERSIAQGIAYWQNPTSDPYGFDAGGAGRGAFLDGSVVNGNSKEAAGLFHSATFITPNQASIRAINGVRIEWLNSFSYFASKGIHLQSGTSGFAGAGLTRLRINSKTGTWNVGNTVKYYDTNGTTLLASGTIASIVDNYVNLTGKCSGFETVTDRLGKTVNINGGAKLSTAQKKYGTASLALDGTGDYLTVASAPDFAFGTGEFTLEAWIYNTVSPGTNQMIFDFRSATPQWAPTFYINATTNTLRFFANGNLLTESTSAISLNTWTHVALSKSGTSTRIFINGVQSGLTYSDTNTYIQGPLTIGARYDGTTAFNGYIDDVRVTKGLGRYTGPYTPPTSALTGDLQTVLLLNCNGANNSTAIVDNGVTLQDLRSYNGASVVGTASLINFADYGDFGVEFRSIGSACVYGTYGVYADGDGQGEGVIAYLISQNFAYVGTGKLSNNDPNDRIAANEVYHTSRAKIYYTSVDNEGNFKVGDAFYVNQKTGEVLFNGQSLNITSLSGITFSDGVHNTIITPQEIDTGNIRISGNTVESVVGDVNINAFSGNINLQNNTNISGNLITSGNLNVNGNTTLGDASTDTINFVGGIATDIIPSVTATYNLGNSTTPLRWKNVYLNRAEVDGLVIDNNTISTTVGNDDLIFTANGTGRVYFPNNNVLLDQSLTVTNNLSVTTGTTSVKNIGVTGTITQTGDINQTGNFTTSGLTQVTGNITGTGYLQLPVITISGNNISTTTTNTDLQLVANGIGNVIFEGIKVQDNNIQSTVTNSNITLTPQGTGIVTVNSNQSLQIPVGTSLEQPASPSVGMIRYSTTNSRYEGWTGSYWQQLGGVIDVAGATYITPELTPGAADNTIRFYTAGAVRAALDANKLSTTTVETNNIRITSNTISTVVPGTDINLTTSGVGGVRLGNLQIKNNTITNVVAGAITEFIESGSGYVRFGGRSGVVIPAGDTANDRPGIVETGMMRFNTVLQLVEIYNGVTWTSVAGSSGGVTVNDATDIGIVTALLFG